MGVAPIGIIKEDNSSLSDKIFIPILTQINNITAIVVQWQNTRLWLVEREFDSLLSPLNGVRTEKMVKIKKAILKDIEGLIKLEEEAKKEFKNWNLTLRPEFVDLVKKKLMYVAKQGERVVGYVNVKIMEGKIILDNVYLKKNLRGKGTGRELMDRILTDLNEMKFKDVIITCPAILKRFYERFKLKEEEK